MSDEWARRGLTEADRSARRERPRAGRLLVALLAVAGVGAGALIAAALVTLVGAFGPSAADAAKIGLAVRSAENFVPFAATAIFAATYLVMAIGKLPGYQLDRAGGALLGASLMVGVGAISLDAAYAAIDFNTITLLLGMMILVANLRLSGFFELVGNWLIARAAHPLALLAAIAGLAGVFSAFLVNDTVCLVLTPLVLHLVKRLKRDPVPYLLAIPLASNAGSTATITGNPQNMIIGSLSHISYAAFAGALWPVAACGVILTVALIAGLYAKEFLAAAPLPKLPPRPTRPHRALMLKSVLIAAAMVGSFFAGQPVAKVAIVGGALLLLTKSVKAEKVYREIDWPLLLMFAGLFIVVAAFEASVMSQEIPRIVATLNLNGAAMLSVLTAVLSNIVSNVPAVLALKPIVAAAPDPNRAWLVVAMASTLAGNFTLVGSVANLIVAQRAASEGVKIGFWPYFKVGAPLTVLTISIGVWLL
jgi:Na+/H+ antiporter NhaD/arsenite permease-like protein